MTDRPLIIDGKEYPSRLIIGTGKYATLDLMRDAIEASGSQMVTVAVRRINLQDRSERSFLSYIDRKKLTILPNTAGCYTAEDAIRIARLGQEAGLSNLVKLEVLGDEATLFPDNEALLAATKVLVKEGFVVLPYTNDDLINARKLMDAGAAAVMPLGAPIGSGMGIQNMANVMILREKITEVPLILDAGVGTASDACVAMELGMDGVLMNTGIAAAQDPVRMARAMNLAVEAGRDAYLAGQDGKEAVRHCQFSYNRNFTSSMIPRDPIEELQKKLDLLVELRKKEEEEYGKLLTLLDERCGFALPQEGSQQLDQIKDSLNRLWDVAPGAYSGFEAEDRLFWKEVARNTAQNLQPFVKQQREFNSLVVHLVNEFVESVLNSLASVRDFQLTLIRYFQKIIPVIDTKFREVVGVEDKNVAINLQTFQKDLHKFQDQIHEAARDHADMLFKELDKRMVTLQADSSDQQDLLKSLQSSLRSLQHLSASLKSAKDDARPIVAPEDYRYHHFEENFRGSRDEIKAKFTDYVKHFRRNLDAPVLDLGCGRGEFLELLKAAGIPAIGVDSNKNMVQQCCDASLEVHHGDLLEFLQSQKQDSLGGIFCSQVVEHLPPHVLMKLLASAFSRLKPGAPILLESVNVGSAFAFLQVYTKDLTHRTLVHPDTLTFLLAAQGFQKPQIIYTSPVPAVTQLKMLAHPADDAQGVFNENMAKLNKLLFGPQEYAVLSLK